MQSSARDNYLVTEVMTATPQKLQLMLIEAAIRSAERARQHWQANEEEQACESLVRAQQVMSEMLGGLNREVDSELVKKVAAVYLFVFRSLMEANHQRSEQKLDDAISVLEVERETWRQVCQQLGSKKGAEGQTPTPQSAPATPPPVAAPPLGIVPSSGMVDDSASSGFSLEA